MYAARGFASLLVILAIVAGLIVLGGGYYAYQQTKSAASPVATATTTQATDEPAVASQTSSLGTSPEMKKYTDSQFGFSFWYPATLAVTESDNLNPSGLVYRPSDVQVLKHLVVGDADIVELYGPSRAVAIFRDQGMPSVDGGSVKYYFDPSLHTWMQVLEKYMATGETYSTSTADVSNNTMGGLHILHGSIFDDSHLVPLSAKNFVYVVDNSGKGEGTPIVSTIVATDLSVATPLSQSAQDVVVEKAADTFAKIFAPAPPVITQTYTDSKLGITIKHPSDFVRTTSLNSRQQHQVITYMSACPWDTKEITAFCYVGNSYPDGFAGAAITVSASTTESSDKCLRVNGGVVYNESGPLPVPTSVTINGVTFYEDKSGDAGLGHYITTNIYTTYHQGACYSIVTNFESYAGPRGDASSIQNELDSILQSFKFTSL